jgi:hypothetical protein
MSLYGLSETRVAAFRRFPSGAVNTNRASGLAQGQDHASKRGWVAGDAEPDSGLQQLRPRLVKNA